MITGLEVRARAVLPWAALSCCPCQGRPKLAPRGALEGHFQTTQSSYVISKDVDIFGINASC